MNPVSESRFLQSFLAVVASLVLVCGVLVLLTSTAPWSPRQEAESDAPAATQAASGASEIETPAAIAFAPPASENDDQNRHAEGLAEPSGGAEVRVAEADLAAPQRVSTQSEDDAIADSVSSQGAEGAGAETEASGAESMMVGDQGTVAEATPADALEAGAVPETEVVDSNEPSTPVVAARPAVEPATPVATETTAVEPATPVAAVTKAVEPATPAVETVAVETVAVETVAAETVAAETAASADPIGKLLTESSPAAIATETIGEDAVDVADPSTTTAPLPAAKNPSAVSDTANPKISAAVPLPPPPPPRRKPKVEPSVSTETVRSAPSPESPFRPEAPKQAQAVPAFAQIAPKQAQFAPVAAQVAPVVGQKSPKQARVAPVAAQQAPAQPGGGLFQWLPMALAPADKPVAKQPAAKLSGAAYASKVWAALARHKPRAGQRGSATVVFSIGAGGGLGGVRIGQSSGNTKIDQLALATVRGAGPFPPPPSGPASFSIRIDFP